MDQELKALLKGRPFLKVYLDLLAIDGIALLDVLIVSYIIYFNVNDNKCFLSSNDLRWALGVSKRAIEKSFKRLKDYGYLEIVHQKNGIKQEKRLTNKFLDMVWHKNTSEEESAVKEQIKALREKLKIRH